MEVSKCLVFVCEGKVDRLLEELLK
jgi:hypothetical protein